MSDAQEHDNRWLIPYLRKVREAEDTGEPLETDATEEIFQQVYRDLVDEAGGDELPDFPGASKIRQTFYIAKLAKKGAGGVLVLTDAGRELLNGVG